MTPERAWDRLERHCDACDECVWWTLQFCREGRALQVLYSLVCAKHGKPIATLNRQPGRA